MIDKLTEEISPPTIILGLGEFGAACLRKMELAADSSATRRLAVVRAVAGADEVALRAAGDRTEVTFPAKEATAAAVQQAFDANSGPLVDWLKAEVELLGRAEAGGAGAAAGRVKVFVVAKAEEIDGSVLAVALPPLIRTHLDGFIANWPVSLAGFFLLPKGRGAGGGEVYSLLREVGDGRPGYDQTFLLSEANVGSVIGEDGAVELIGEFADLMTETRFEAAVAEIMDVSGAAVAGFGLTCVVQPVDRLIAREAARFGRELVREGILAGAGDSFYRAADEYLKTEGFEVGALMERLLADEEGGVLDRVTVGAVELRGLSLSLWTDRMSSYADYLERERLPRLVGRMDENLDDIARRALARLTAKIDDLMTEPGALDKATVFIDRLDERAGELRETARTKAKADLDRTDDLRAFRDNLADRVRKFPNPLAVGVRAAVLTPLVFFFFRNFATVLARFPDDYINPAYVPPPGPTGAAALAVTVAFLFLLYRRAEGGLMRARDLYIQAIERKYRGALTRAAWELLDGWLGETWPDIIGGERKCLREFKKEYLRLAVKLGQPESVNLDSAVSRSVTEIFGIEDGLRYKRGRYDVAEEAGRFSAWGHRDWRTSRPDTIRRSLDEFCRRGLSFVDKRSVDKLVLELIAREDQSAAFLDDLRRRSRPFAAMAAALPPVVEIAGIPGGRQSPLAWRLLKEATVVETAGLHRLAFAQLVCPIKVDDLAAFPEWRRAYEDREGQKPGEAA